MENLRIKRIIVVDDLDGSSVVYERVQKNSDSRLFWLNCDQPVLDVYLTTEELADRYSSYDVVGFFPDGKEPPHACGIFSIARCRMCNDVSTTVSFRKYTIPKRKK